MADGTVQPQRVVYISAISRAILADVEAIIPTTDVKKAEMIRKTMHRHYDENGTRTCLKEFEQLVPLDSTVLTAQDLKDLSQGILDLQVIHMDANGRPKRFPKPWTDEMVNNLKKTITNIKPNTLRQRVFDKLLEFVYERKRESDSQATIKVKSEPSFDSLPPPRKRKPEELDHEKPLSLSLDPIPPPEPVHEGSETEPDSPVLAPSKPSMVQTVRVAEPEPLYPKDDLGTLPPSQTFDIPGNMMEGWEISEEEEDLTGWSPTLPQPKPTVPEGKVQQRAAEVLTVKISDAAIYREIEAVLQGSSKKLEAAEIIAKVKQRQPKAIDLTDARITDAIEDAALRHDLERTEMWFVDYVADGGDTQSSMTAAAVGIELLMISDDAQDNNPSRPTDLPLPTPATQLEVVPSAEEAGACIIS